MKHTAVFRAISIATITSLALVGAATASSAAPAEATLIIGNPGVLTLPAGDGVRDTTTVQVTSDVGTNITLTAHLDGAVEGTIIASAEVTDEALAHTFEVSVDGLVAGDYDLVATPSAGEPVATELTVGSGVARNASITLSAATIYTWSKATPHSTTATVSAKDETGLTVPFTGTVKAAVGGKTVNASVKSTTGAAKTADFSVTKLKAGSGKVTATLQGAGPATATTDANLKVLQTAVTKVALKSSQTTVFPAKDGYKDSAKLTVTPTTTTGKAFVSTGSVTITYKGKTIKSWKITSSKTQSVTWDGKNKGKVVPGTYTVKVSVKGPEGAAKTATTKVKVDKGKLVTKKTSVTLNASKVFKKFVPYDYDYEGFCGYDYPKKGNVYCASQDAYDFDFIALATTGAVAVPAAVVSGQKYGGATAKVTTNFTTVTGDAGWAYDVTASGLAKIDDAKKGKRTLGALKLPATSKKVYLTILLGEYSTVVASTVKVDYTYKVMKR